MSQQDQINHLSDDLDALINRYKQEYELTYAAAIGVLTMKIHTLISEAIDISENGEQP